MKNLSCDLCPGLHFRSTLGWIRHHRKGSVVRAPRSGMNRICIGSLKKEIKKFF
jgi:hypothetical protein